MSKLREKTYPKTILVPRDMLCILLFVVFVGMDIFFVRNAFNKGADPEKVFSQQNHKGDLCGDNQDLDTKDHKLVFIEGFDSLKIGKSQCVKECPKSSTSKVLCSESSCPTSQGSRPVLRICLPTSTKLSELFTLMQTKISGQDDVQKALSDIECCRQAIGWMALIALLISQNQVAMLKQWTGVFSKVTVLVLWALLGLLCYMTFTQQIPLNFDDDKGKVQAGQGAYLTQGTQGSIQAFSVLIVAVCFSFRNKFEMAVAVMKAGADAVGDMKALLLVPVVHLVCVSAFVWLWMQTFLGLLSTADMSKQPDSFQPQFSFTDKQKQVLYTHCFGLFWSLSFMFNFVTYFQSSCFTKWQFFQDGQNDLEAPSFWFMKSLLRTIFHVGTIAFGSLLMAICKVVRLMLSIFTKKARAVKAEDWFVMRMLLAIANGILWLLEKFIMQVSKQSQVHSSFTGQGFCGASQSSLMVLLSNPLLFTITQVMEDIIAQIGRLTIALATTLSFYGMLQMEVWPDLNKNLSSSLPLGPLLAVFFVGWLIASEVLNIWDMASDVVMYCFMFDWDRKDAKPTNQPYQLKDLIPDFSRMKDSQNEKHKTD